MTDLSVIICHICHRGGPEGGRLHNAIASGAGPRMRSRCVSHCRQCNGCGIKEKRPISHNCIGWRRFNGANRQLCEVRKAE